MVRFCFALTMFFAVANSAVADSDYILIGDAYHAGDLDQLLYREKYTERNADGQAEVHYSGPEGEPLARKTLDYRYGDRQPGFVLTDQRLDQHWSVQRQGEHLALTRGAPDRPDEKRISVREPQVIDAGFDGFIQDRWEELLQGERVPFYFAVPNRLDNVRLRAERISYEDSPIKAKQPEWVYFRIRIASALVALFVDNLYLAYSPEDKQLMVFRGRSNLPDAQGDAWDVEIHYRHR